MFATAWVIDKSFPTSVAIMLRVLPYFIGVSLLIIGAKAISEETPVESTSELPQPLTLDKLMALPLEGVAVLQSDAMLSAQQQRLDLAQSKDDAEWTLHLTPRYVQPSILSPNQQRNDSHASLIISKLLYDFGRQSNAELSAQFALEAAQIKNAMDKNLYRLNLMKAYFDVILADLTFLRDNEAMSVAYVRLDRLKAKKDLDQVNVLDVAEQTQIYQKERVKYFKSRSAQQTSRAYLAMLMNRPNQLVADMPDPTVLEKRDIPELEVILKQIMENNPALKLQKRLLSASESKMQQARSQRWPRINASAGYFQYQRELPSQNDWSVEVDIAIPLWQGDRASAAIGEAVALKQQQELEVRNTELALRQQTHELLETLRALQASREQAKQLLEYRDQKLDLSRIRYEQELQSDLGDSMVNVSAAKLEVMQVETQRILAWAQLQALMGMPVYPIVEVTGAKQ